MKDNNLIVWKDYLNPEKLNTESDLIARILSGAEKMDSRILLGPGDDGAVFKNEKKCYQYRFVYRKYPLSS